MSTQKINKHYKKPLLIDSYPSLDHHVLIKWGNELQLKKLAFDTELLYNTVSIMIHSN